MVRSGDFREDLYHRLNVIRLRLPPLRDRSEDVPLLVHHFLARSAKNLNVEPKKMADDAMEFLEHFSFPGNVRQLENICNWLTVMAPSQTIRLADLPEEVRSGSAGTVHRIEEEAGEVPCGLWQDQVASVAKEMLRNNEADVMKALSDEFERAVYKAALEVTHGKRIEAAQRLGVGRNTITRKLKELGMDDI